MSFAERNAKMQNLFYGHSKMATMEGVAAGTV
jgi:hypothetical protein